MGGIPKAPFGTQDGATAVGSLEVDDAVNPATAKAQPAMWRKLQVSRLTKTVLTILGVAVLVIGLILFILPAFFFALLGSGAAEQAVAIYVVVFSVSSGALIGLPRVREKDPLH